MKVCNIDFETGSEVDLTKVGAYNYATHPSTRVHCLAYTFDGGVTMKLWQVGQDQLMPADLDAALDDRDVIFHAWNAAFERLIFRDVLGIEIPIHRFRCTAARARAMALPGALGLCGRALDLEVQKSDDAVMRRWMRPVEGVWASDADDYWVLCGYCADDVRAEIAIGELLRNLTDEEQEDYQICEAMNDRGIPIDLNLAAAAQGYAEAELKDIKATLNVLTRGRVTSPKQFIRIKAWLAERLPVELQLKPDDKGKTSCDATVREVLLAPDNEDIITGEVREFVQLVHDGGRASTAKFAAMQCRAGSDGRVRGAYVFNGAGQTHRFSSHGLQVHNFIRKKLSNVDVVVDAICEGVSPEVLIELAGDEDGRPLDVMTILSRCLRPAIYAEEGKQLVWGDWEQIEARVLPWLSGQESANELLDTFRRGEDVYVRQAVLTYGVVPSQITKEQRQSGGKIPVLAFGFGGGAGAMLSMARAYSVRMSEAEANELKNRWRATNPWAPRFWRDLELAAIRAVNEESVLKQAGRVTYLYERQTLWCCLPSGRVLAYPLARLEEIEGESRVTCIKGSFRPKKGEKDWPRMTLWGGIQAEHCTQAEAASLLRYGARELVRNGWPLIGHTHDELLLEVWDDEVEEAKAALHDIMVNVDSCFSGLPLAAEVQSGRSYTK